MSRWASRRHRPSAAARHRLADAIRRNRAELEVQVAEGLLRSELYLETGRPAAAAQVLEEQRLRLVSFHGQVRDALAAASVEADAEAVLSGARGVQVLHDTVEPARPAVEVASRVPNLVAAALAAIASLGVLTVLDVGSQADGPLASVRIGASDEFATVAIDVSGPIAPDVLRFSHYGSGLAAPFPATQVPDQATAGAWLAEHDTMLERLGLRPRVRTQVLRELQGLVATLVPGTPVTDEMWLQMLSNAVAAADDEATDETADQERSAVGQETSEQQDSEDAGERRSWLSREHSGEDGSDGSDGTGSEETSEQPTTPEAPDAGGDEPSEQEDAPPSAPSDAPGADATGSGDQFLSGR